MNHKYKFNKTFSFVSKGCQWRSISIKVQRYSDFILNHISPRYILDTSFTNKQDSKWQELQAEQQTEEWQTASTSIVFILVYCTKNLEKNLRKIWNTKMSEDDKKFKSTNYVSLFLFAF